MSEEQREWTEEELQEGIPVDPPEVESELDEDEQVALEEVVEPVELPALTASERIDPIEDISMSIRPEHLLQFGYVAEHTISGTRTIMFTAEGVRHIAMARGVSIESCDVRIADDGESVYGEAWAVRPASASKAFASVKVPTKYKNGKPDPHAWEKCTTKVQRNALKQLLPIGRLLRKCTEIMRGK